MTAHRATQVLLHPRTSAFVETIYAGHGLHAADGWTLMAIYFGLLLVSLAHLIWAHLEVA